MFSLDEFASILALYRECLLGFFGLSIPLGSELSISFGSLFVGVIGLFLFIHVLRYMFSSYDDK